MSSRFLTPTIIFIFIPLIWGFTFPLIHSAVSNITPALFVFIRFSLASIILLFFLKKSRHDFSKKMLIYGAWLGFINIGIFLFQTIGMQTVDGPRTAFITALSVIMVPFLSPLFKLGKPGICDYVAAIICLLGIYYLTGARLDGFTIGDAWVFGCAVSTAISIITIQVISKHIENAANFAFLQITFTVVWVLPALQHESPHALHIMQSLKQPIVLGALGFCALFATVIAFFLQIKYQQHITAFKAALILALEPVFATIFAAWFFGNKLSLSIIIGGSLVVLSTIIADLYHFCRRFIRSN